MTHHSLAGAPRRWLLASLLFAGCFSRWSGCRSYDTGHLSGPNWKARVQCDPHTEIGSWRASRNGIPRLQGCSAKWSFIVERARYPQSFELRGPEHHSADCGDVRSFCATSHGELAQHPTTSGTWVAGRAPGGKTRVAFVPASCGIAQTLPEEDSANMTPPEAVAKQPDGAAFLDRIVARARITDTTWFLVCGAVLSSRVEAVRAAAVECRTPDVVANELFRTNPESVDVVWRAYLEGRLECHDTLLQRIRAVAVRALSNAVLRTLAECAVRCEPRAHLAAVREAGELRLGAARDALLRITETPPTRVAPDAPREDRARYEAAADLWIAAHQSLVFIDARQGTATALASLRRLPPSGAPPRMPTSAHGPPIADYDDLASALFEILTYGDATTGREGLWQLASDESLDVGVRQRALLTLGRLGDARASGASLAHNPLTAEQSAWVAASLAEAHSTGGASPSGGASGHHHSHHHWH